MNLNYNNEFTDCLNANQFMYLLAIIILKNVNGSLFISINNILATFIKDKEILDKVIFFKKLRNMSFACILVLILLLIQTSSFNS